MGRGTKHFSHPHALQRTEILKDDGEQCSGCDQSLSGSAYARLTLLPHSDYPGGWFGCNACGVGSAAFLYHCPSCDFDLHVDCAFMPESVTRDDREHPLTLHYSFPCEDGWLLVCDVCKDYFSAGEYWLSPLRSRARQKEEGGGVEDFQSGRDRFLATPRGCQPPLQKFCRESGLMGDLKLPASIASDTKEDVDGDGISLTGSYSRPTSSTEASISFRNWFPEILSTSSNFLIK
ncbi:hypothetical protein NMG60_11023304 [Bertholletia excelsa]